MCGVCQIIIEGTNGNKTKANKGMKNLEFQMNTKLTLDTHLSNVTQIMSMGIWNMKNLLPLMNMKQRKRIITAKVKTHMS